MRPSSSVISQDAKEDRSTPLEVSRWGSWDLNPRNQLLPLGNETGAWWKTQVFSSFLVDSGGMIKNLCLFLHLCGVSWPWRISHEPWEHSAVAFMMAHKCCFITPTERATWGIVCNSVSTRPYFLLLKKSCFCNKLVPGHISPQMCGHFSSNVHTTHRLSFDAHCHYQQVRTMSVSKPQAPPPCPNS